MQAESLGMESTWQASGGKGMLVKMLKKKGNVQREIHDLKCSKATTWSESRPQKDG